MNFSTECLQDLLVLKKGLHQSGMTLDETVLDMTIANLVASTKFLLPSPSHMNVTATKAALKFMRLPYAVCAFEYSCPEARVEGVKGAPHLDTAKSTRRIALAYDCTRDSSIVLLLKRQGLVPKDSKGIVVQSLYYLDTHGMWVPSFAAGYIDEEVVQSGEFLLNNKNLFFQIDACPMMTENIMENFGHLQGRDLAIAMLNDVADEVGMAVRACLLLNTRNLKVVKAVEAPAALNKKRAKTGKPPFFEYHTLDIFVSDAGSRLARKRVDQNYVRKLFSNMNVERKWGTVIGHFKIRKTGMFFWRDHTRGSKEKGIVGKDYTVKNV